MRGDASAELDANTGALLSDRPDLRARLAAAQQGMIIHHAANVPDSYQESMERIRSMMATDRHISDKYRITREQWEVLQATGLTDAQIANALTLGVAPDSLIQVAALQGAGIALDTKPAYWTNRAARRAAARKRS